MKNISDLILKMALTAAFVLTTLLDSPVIKSMIALLLAVITILVTMLKFKYAREITAQDKFFDIIGLIVIVGAAAFLIYKMVSLQ